MSQRLPAHSSPIAFGPFCLYAHERRLEKDGAEVKLGSRALDILIALSERAGDVVSKEELTARVWPDTVVEDSGLRVQIAALRKALGGNVRYITNVPGRGYCFVAQLSRESVRAAPSSAPSAPQLRRSALPPRLERIVGRDDTIRELCATLLQKRFVSIVGSGGMGKTTVAIAVAHELANAFASDVCFVDLGALTDPDQVGNSVASAVGLAISGGDASAGLVAFLEDRRMLLVLDSCEHVMTTLAPLTERLFVATTLVHVITTSREALRVEGEHIHRLLPLEIPPEDETLDAQQVAGFSSVQLFMQRASAGGARLELSDADAAAVAAICRGVDGIALAIEFAAGRVQAYGIRGTASLLENRLRLMWQGRRTAPPRHRTLAAMIDWSHGLLDDVERTTLRRLSILVGRFSASTAIAIAGDSESEADTVVEALESLIEKSLAVVDASAGRVSYRLLDTTRVYAQNKLDEAGERDLVSRRLAQHLCQYLESEGGTADDLGNARAALAWCFSESGQASLGTALAAASAPLFMGLSLLLECQRWVEFAVAALTPAERGTRRELNLRASLGISAMFTSGNTEKVRSELERMLAIADELDDPEQQLRVLGPLQAYFVSLCEFRQSHRIALRAEAVAERQGPNTSLLADWMIGFSAHLLGQQLEAERRCASALAPPPASRGLANVGFGFSHRMRGLGALCRTLWLLGRADDAREAARAMGRIARESGQPTNTAIACVYTSSVFLWSGDFATAQAIIEELLAVSAKYSLPLYREVGRAMKGELWVKRGSFAAGLELLRPALASLRAGRDEIITVYSTAVAEALAGEGQVDAALATLDQTIALTTLRNGDAFDISEMWRVKGQLLAQCPAREAEAESCLQKALEVASRQSALGFELRAAIALAGLLGRQGRISEAVDLLGARYERFTQGFGTADLKCAKQLLAELRRAPGEGQ